MKLWKILLLFIFVIALYSQSGVEYGRYQRQGGLYINIGR